jgi:hypothetical protein
MSEYITVEQTLDNINVVIDDRSPNIYYLLNIIGTLSSSYDRLNRAATNVEVNSSAYFNPEEVEKINTLQTLTSNFVETYHEVNTIQDILSANWQKTSELYDDPIIDGGSF